MARAVWKGVVLAESEDVKVIEGNHYFPPDSVHWEYLRESRRAPCAHGKAELSIITLRWPES